MKKSKYTESQIVKILKEAEFVIGGGNVHARMVLASPP